MARDRRLSDWLSGYLEYTFNTEPPLSYHVWTGLSVIAAALQRKVWMDWNRVRIFPNMYVVLVGPSGRCKKGTAMNMGKSLLRDIETVKFTANAMTRESLVKQMMDAETSFIDPDIANNDLTFHSSLTVFSDELSVFLGQNDVKFLANLTDWYDSQREWEYETVGRGKELIKGVCLNILGGTAPDWFQSILPDEAIGGGFTSRIFFIVEEKKRKTIPFHEPTKLEIRLEKALAEDLERINKIKGYYEFTEGALELYENWYVEEDRKIDKGDFPVKDIRFAGYCDRRATHIKKLGMIFAASRSRQMVIDINDFESAREVMEKAEIKMPKAFAGFGQSDYANITGKIINFFQGSNGLDVKRETLLIQFYRDMDLPTWEIIKSQLVAMKYIKVTIDPMQNEEEYKWLGPTRI